LQAILEKTFDTRTLHTPPLCNGNRRTGHKRFVLKNEIFIWGNIDWALKHIKNGKLKILFERLKKSFDPLNEL
jgi:hypothetical protein